MRVAKHNGHTMEDSLEASELSLTECGQQCSVALGVIHCVRPTRSGRYPGSYGRQENSSIACV